MARPKSLSTLSSFAAFFIYACIVSSFFSRMLDLKLELELDERTMGFLLLSLPGGVIVGSLVVSNLIDRYSPKMIFVFGMPVFSIFPFLAINASSLSLAFIILFLYGLLSSTVNIAINVDAYRIEEEYDVSILNRSHGFFSFGFFIFSFSAVFLVNSDVSASAQHFLVFLLVSSVMLFMYLLHVRNMSLNQTVIPDVSAKETTVLALPTLSIILVLLYAAFGLIMDGIARSWGVIYVQKVFQVDASIAVLALTFLIVGISAGRFLADGIIVRHGAVMSAKILLLITLLGIGLVTHTTNYIHGLLGIGLIGFGVSTVHPQSIRAVASLKERTPAQSIAAFSTIQTMLMYLGPSSYGLLAYYFGLRAGILFFLPLAVVAYLASRYLKD